MDEARPTMNGTKVDGKTTKSLSGINGTFWMFSNWLFDSCIQ